MRKMRIDEEDETEIIAKMRKRDSFKDNNDIDYNDDEYDDIVKVREIKIGQEDEDNEEPETEDNSENEENG